MESTFVLVQTAAFSRLLVLMGLHHVQQFKITSFSAAQLHDELDVSGTTCPHCGRSPCSWTVSLVGSGVSDVSCVTMDQLWAAVQPLQKKERFHFGQTLLVVARVL